MTGLQVPIAPEQICVPRRLGPGEMGRQRGAKILQLRPIFLLLNPPIATDLLSQHSYPLHLNAGDELFCLEFVSFAFLNSFTFLAPRLSKATSVSYAKAGDQMQIEANSTDSYVPSHGTYFHSLFIAHRDNAVSEQNQKTPCMAQSCTLPEILLS